MLQQSNNNYELSLVDILVLDEVKTMKEQPWWTACQMTPFLIKGAIVGENYILIITNLRQTWVSKADRQQITKEKKLYNSSIETETFAGICELLEQVITKYNQKATYVFEQDDQQKTLTFNYHSLIQIYPLKWCFKLTQIKDQEHFDLICSDLINPLVCTVRSQEQRCMDHLFRILIKVYKEALHFTELELTKRLNEKEKQAFKSKVVDGQEEWKNFLSESSTSGNYRISSLTFGAQANYFIKYYTMEKLLSKFVDSLKVKNENIKKERLLNKLKLVQWIQKVLEKYDIENAMLHSYEQQLFELFNSKTKDPDVEIIMDDKTQSKMQKKKDKKRDFF